MIRALPALAALAFSTLAVFAPAVTPETAAAQEAEGTAAPEVAEMSMGDPDAPVTVIEYASFTCPHCAHFAEDVFPEIKENYIDTGKVHFIYREVYFGEDPRPSLWPGMVARCGGETRYFGIVDMIFEQQDDWTRAGSAQEMVDQLKKIGRTAGLTDEELDACLSDGAKAQALYDSWVAHLAEDKIDATPSFIVNGLKYSNMGYEDFARLLDEKLAE